MYAWSPTGRRAGSPPQVLLARPRSEPRSSPVERGSFRQSGDRKRAADRRRRARGACNERELLFQGFNLARQLDRGEQLGALGNDGRDGLRFLQREPAGTDVVEQVGIGQRAVRQCRDVSQQIKLTVPEQSVLFTLPACDDGGFGKRLRVAWLLARPSPGLSKEEEDALLQNCSDHFGYPRRLLRGLPARIWNPFERGCTAIE